MARWVHTAAAAVALLLGSTACGAGAGDDTAAGGGAAGPEQNATTTFPGGEDFPTSTTEGAPTAGKPAADFSGPRLGGGQVDAVSYAGEDVALWFWAPW